MPISDQTAVAIWRLIESLSQNEGDNVTILCPNYDFNNLPDYAIECNGQWTNYEDHRIYGNSYLECLTTAITYKNLFHQKAVENFKNGFLGIKNDG